MLLLNPGAKILLISEKPAKVTYLFFVDDEHTSRQSGYGQHYIGAFNLSLGLLEGYGMLVLHTVGYSKRAWGIILERCTLYPSPIALDTQGGGRIGRINHLYDDIGAILGERGAYTYIARFAAIGQTVL